MSEHTAHLQSVPGLVNALWSSHQAFLLDADGVVMAASDRVAEVGIRDAAGKPLGAIVIDESQAELARLWSQARAGASTAGVLRFLRPPEARSCWLHLTFTPVPGDGTVLAFGSDVTGTHRDYDDAVAQLRAIDTSKAVIEFDLDGYIRRANQNFLDAVGYALEEIRGKHHRIFVLPEERESEAYAEFWRRLGSGESFSAQYERVTKSGRRIWIEATYSSVKTPSGKPYKVVKFCSDITQLVESFVELRAAATNIGDASRRIATSSQQLDASVRETQADIESVSRSADEVVAHSNEMSTGLERLRSSVAAVASHATEATRVAKQAVDTARASDEQMRELEKSSEEIGGILKTIASIAQQTNLLALNATIEAARAGAAGKGFAVVATEVKELAKETAKATEDIEQKIEAIRAGTAGAMQALRRILEIIESIDAAQSSISAAVESQTDTVHDIGQSIERSREGIGAIAGRAGSATEQATGAQSMAGDANRMASELEGLAERLRRLADAADPRKGLRSGPEPAPSGSTRAA